jgi:hypothetical protein
LYFTPALHERLLPLKDFSSTEGAYLQRLRASAAGRGVQNDRTGLYIDDNTERQDIWPYTLIISPSLRATRLALDRGKLAMWEPPTRIGYVKPSRHTPQRAHYGLS